MNEADWPMMRWMTRIVWRAPGGGLHRRELAERLGGISYTDMKQALMVAYKLGKIDFCGPYVVRPSPKSPPTQPPPPSPTQSPSPAPTPSLTPSLTLTPVSPLSSMPLSPPTPAPASSPALSRPE